MATGIETNPDSSPSGGMTDAPPQVPWRDARAGAGWGFASISALLLALVAVGLGSWWTARAVIDGDPAGTLLRFALSAVAGVYYMTLFRTSRRQAFR